MGRREIDACVEALCQKGCRSVRDDIATLERGESLPETHGMEPGDVGAVLDELKSVMAAYGDACRPGDG
jgi:hypothetical protein